MHSRLNAVNMVVLFKRTKPRIAYPIYLHKGTDLDPKLHHGLLFPFCPIFSVNSWVNAWIFTMSSSLILDSRQLFMLNILLKTFQNMAFHHSIHSQCLEIQKLFILTYLHFTAHHLSLLLTMNLTLKLSHKSSCSLIIVSGKNRFLGHFLCVYQWKFVNLQGKLI